MNQELRQKIQGMEEEVITWRRQLHKYPELSFKEYRTTGYIKEALAGLSGIQVSHPTETIQEMTPGTFWPVTLCSRSLPVSR